MRRINLLYPLDLFYMDTMTKLPSVEAVRWQDVPQPFDKLLVGEHDMTPTLERHHGAQIELRLLGRHLSEDTYRRLVVLQTIGDGKPVEFGAIVINLEHFPAHARELVLDGHIPLGSILAMERIEHTSWPQAFVRVQPDDTISGALGLSESQPLYGRRNYLLAKDGRILADILEVLPP